MAARDENQFPHFDFDLNFNDFSHEIDDEILGSISIDIENAKETDKTDETFVAKKPRFAEVAADEINKLLDDAQANKTKANTNYFVIYLYSQIVI